MTRHMNTVFAAFVAFALAAPAASFAQTAEKPADPAPQAGQSYVKGTFGDWELRCLLTPQNQEQCQISQLMFGPEGNPIAEFSVFAIPPSGDAVAGASVLVPLDTLLLNGVGVALVEGLSKTYPVHFCSPGGCVAQIGLTEQEIAQMKRGDKGTLRISPLAAPDEVVNVDLSFKGFTAGYTALLAQ